MNTRPPTRIRPLAASASFVCILALALAALAAPAQADTYQAQGRTVCSIDGPSEITRGSDFRARVEVTSDGNVPVTGVVTMTFRGAGGGVISQRSAPYDDAPVTISSPRFTTVGTFTRELTFEPSGSALRSCSAQSRFGVVGSSVSTDPPGTDPSATTGTAPDGGIAQNGVLPDTGGPAMLWLLLGLALLAAGGGAVVYSRREDAYRS